MPTSRDALHIAIAGKGAERGLSPEITTDYVILRYEGEVTEREDNLHKQSLRALVERMGGDDWKPSIKGIEGGIEVRVYPKKSGIDMPPAVPVEHIGQVEPGPVMAGREVDLDDAEQLQTLAEQLAGIAEKLGKIAVAAIALTGPLA